MSTSVLITDIVDALEMQIDEYSTFLDLDKGKVESVPLRILSQAEEEPETEPNLLTWEKDLWTVAQRIVASNRFISLPGKNDVDDWTIMQDFVLSRKSSGVRDDLATAIRSKGAFRVFKDTILRLKLEQEWFAYRGEALRQIAVDWCEENKIPWHG